MFLPDKALAGLKQQTLPPLKMPQLHGMILKLIMVVCPNDYTTHKRRVAQWCLLWP